MTDVILSPTSDENDKVQPESLDFLIHEVSLRCQWTVSALQVAAMLESLGVTDKLAQDKYGYSDVFALADALMVYLPHSYHNQLVGQGDTALSSPEEESWRDKMRDYMRGVASLLPMIVLSMGIIIHQLVGNWQPQQVWLVGMAMLLSLLVTGGFMQAASRRGSIYLSQGYVWAAQRIIFRIMALCLLVVMLVNLLMVGLPLALSWLSWYDAALMSGAFVSLSLIWLGSSLLYLLDKAHLFLWALVVGMVGSSTMLPLFIYGVLAYEIVVFFALGVGLLLFMWITAVSARYALSKLYQASAVGNQPIRLPTNAHLTINLLPYFLYGSIYILLIMSGHIVAWVGYTGELPRIIAVFDVELALSFALGGAILTSGVSEHTIRRFWRRVQQYQLRTTHDQLHSFSEMLTQFYRSEQRVFLRALLVNMLMTLIATWGFINLMRMTGFLQLTWTNSTTILFALGLVGYGLMAWALFQSMFMITLSRPWWVIQGLFMGTLTTFIVGIAIGLYTYYPYAGLGIIIGNLVFLYMTRQRLNQLLARADYYFYASF